MREKLEKALKPLDDDTTEIRVSMSFENDRFRLAVFLVIDQEIWDGELSERKKLSFAFKNS